MATERKLNQCRPEPQKEPTLLEMVQKGLANCKEILSRYEKQPENCKAEIALCEGLIEEIKAGKIPAAAEQYLRKYFKRC